MTKPKKITLKAFAAISNAPCNKGSMVTVFTNKDDIEGLLYMFCDIVPCTITYTAKAERKA